MNRIEEITHITRNQGHTNWILKSAIENPNVIVVGRDMRTVDYLRRQYFKIIKKSSWWRKLFWKIKPLKQPTFKSMNGDFHGYNKPIVFDNSCF